MILIAIALVGGAFAFAEYRNKDSQIVYEKQDISVSTSTDMDISDKNTDWKKILLTSDLTSTSTKSGTSTNSVKDLTKKAGDDLTTTDKLARDFFKRYLELREIGMQNSTTSQKQLIDVTVNKIPLETPKAYTIDQINAIQDISNAAIKKYGNDIGSVFKKYTVHSRNEGTIAKEALQNSDPETLKELDPIIQSYKSMLNAFIKINVPQSMSKMHLDLVNAMNGALFVTESLRKTMIDPISGIQAISQFQITTQGLFESLSSIKNYIMGLGITYDNSEDGHLFIK